VGIKSLRVSADLRRQGRMLEVIALLERWGRTYNLTKVCDPLPIIYWTAWCCPLLSGGRVCWMWVPVPVPRAALGGPDA